MKTKKTNSTESTTRVRNNVKRTIRVKKQAQEPATVETAATVAPEDAKKAAMKEKRHTLNALSQALIKANKDAKKPETPVNNLLKLYYAEGGHTELHTFNDWRKLGYTVKAGAKALLLWGKPRRNENETEEQAPFFPLAFLFSNIQVVRTTKK